MKLTIELVPETSFYKNVRSEVKRSVWDKLRKECYRNAGYRCEICNGRGPNHPVECHEIWEYEDLTEPLRVYKQTLKGLISLCPSCHSVKHIGLARILGKYEEAVAHFIKINQISERDANDYIYHMFELWHKRSKVLWKVDISWLDKRL